jgi:predicted PurR-regulated permease PerM
MSTSKPDSHAFYLKRLLTVLRGIFILGIVTAMYVARDFLLPVTLALLIAITFRPAVRWLAIRGVPAWGTATGFATVLMLGGLLAGYMISGPVAHWIDDAPEIRRTFIEKIRTIAAPFEHVAKITDDIQDVATPPSDAPVQEVIVKESGLPSLLWIVAYPAGSTIMFTGAVILSLFLMASGNLIYEKLLRLMPTLTDKKNALRVVHDVEREVSVYLLTLTFINAGVGAAIGVSYYLIGMPTAYLWGFFGFALNFIPYAGPLAGAILSGLISFVVFDSLSYALLAPVLYTAIVTIENQFVSPHVLARRLQINSIAILLAVAFWGWIWGIFGIVVAVPFLVTLRVFSSHFDSLSAVGEVLGEASSSNDTSTQSVITVEQRGAAN